MDGHEVAFQEGIWKVAKPWRDTDHMVHLGDRPHAVLQEGS